MKAQTDYPAQHRDGVPVFDPDEMPESSPQPHRSAREPRPAPPRIGRWAFIGFIALIAALVVGFVPRLRNRAIAAEDTQTLSIPNVLTLQPAPGNTKGTL